MLNRRDFIIRLSALLAAGAVQAPLALRCIAAGAPDADRDFAVSGDAPLKSRAARKGLLFGAASMKAPLFENRKYAADFVRECRILVPQNELKWRALRPTPYQFNFEPGDWLERFARKNGLLFRGHTLVWHEALPDWFGPVVNRRNAEKYLRDHIATVAGHYAGKMHSWDVVNEPLQPWDGQPGGLCNSPWLKLLGPGYIELAFRAAAAADPRALLVLNQNQLEYDTREEDACRGATLKLLERLRSAKTPLHALGIQAHLAGDGGRFNAGKFRSFLHDVAGLGLKIMITEMDVADRRLPADPRLRDRVVAGKYEEFLSVALDEPAVIAVMTWGVGDRYSWLADKPRPDRAAVRPLPLDENGNRKLAWNAIARALDRAPGRGR